MEGIDKPRKKRGRPPKASSEEQKNTTEVIEQKKDAEEEEEELDADGRRKRRIKVPARFLEAVQVINDSH